MVTAVLCIVIGLTLFLCGVFIFTFVRRDRMKTPIIIFLLNLAIVDTLGAVLWTIFTAVSSATGEWLLSGEICRMQVWFMGFCNAVNMHTLAILLFERFLRFLFPSKHQEIVFDTVVLLALAAIWLFDGVIATFPTWGWGQTDYFSNQYQCAIDYEKHVSQLHFTLVIHFVLPVLLAAAFYAASLIRLHMIRRKLQPGQAIILEENMDIQGDGYAERLKRQYMTFKDTGDNSKKARIKESKLDQDGFMKESDNSSSDDEKTPKQKDLSFNESNQKQTKKKTKSKRIQKKTHYLCREDILLTHMFGLMALSYFLCWFLYIIEAYIYTYSPKTLDDTFVAAAVCLSHFGSCIKVPFYLMYPRIRNSLKKSVRKGSDKSGKLNKNTTDEQIPEQTTELWNFHTWFSKSGAFISGFGQFYFCCCCCFNMANSVDPDETAHHDLSHQNLRCLQRLVFLSVLLEGVTAFWTCNRMPKLIWETNG